MTHMVEETTVLGPVSNLLRSQIDPLQKWAELLKKEFSIAGLGLA